jgi:hypothetical protein
MGKYGVPIFAVFYVAAVIGVAMMLGSYFQ